MQLYTTLQRRFPQNKIGFLIIVTNFYILSPLQAWWGLWMKDNNILYDHNTHTHNTYCTGTLIYTAHDAHSPQMERAGTAVRPAGKPWVGGVFWHAHKITHSYSSVSERHVFKHTHTHTRCHIKQSLHDQVRDTDVTYCKHTTHLHALHLHLFIWQIFLSKAPYSVFKQHLFYPWESSPWNWHCWHHALTGTSFGGDTYTQHISCNGTNK